jgi:hypothetical protein
LQTGSRGRGVESVDIGKGITSAVSGSVQGLHLMVVDIEASRAELFGKRYVRRDREDSFAEAKLQRLGNISLTAIACEPFFRN